MKGVLSKIEGEIFMKKTQKIISLSFFSLIALTFFMLFVNCIAEMGTIIDSFHYFGDYWGVIIAWFLETGLSITILVMSIMSLMGILQEKETDAKKLVKKNYFFLFLYFVVSVVGGIFTLINAIQSAGGYNYIFTKVIVLIVFEIAGAVLAILACTKDKKESLSKKLGGSAYSILFITLVFTASSGIKGFIIVFFVFMFLVNIFGAFHALTYHVDFNNLFKKQETSAPVEEIKENVEEVKEEENNDANNA